MAIYRSDQAQFTFAAEGAAGGAPERLDSTSLYTAVNLAVAASKGDRQITVNAVGSNINTSTKQFIIIDGAEAAGATSELRRVIAIEGTTILHLDSPLAFDHAVGTGTVVAIDHSASDETPDNVLGDHSGGSDAATTSAYITWIPGIYDTIDVPDPVEAHEARYMLGQNSVRNPYQMVKGQQSLSGSVAGITLINGWPLRFPLGTVQTNTLVNGANGLTSALASPMARTQVAGNKGEVWLRFHNTETTGSTTIAIPAAGTYLAIAHANTMTATTKCEIRKIIYSPGGTVAPNGNAYVRLNAPLHFTHLEEAASTVIEIPDTVAEAAGSRFTHEIFDAVELDSVTWNVNMKDENGANTFQRRYTGGKIGSMTLTAEEGGLVTCDWDSATFLNFSHNQQYAANTGTGDNFVRRYLPMLDIGKADVGVPEIPNTLPTSNPYYFSEGTVKFFNQTVARVRTFSLTVSNGEEPKYYIRDTKDDSRSPFEIKEGNREYSMTATIALPDAAGPESTAQNVWKELITASTGIAADGTAGGGFSGFDIQLKFVRDGDDEDQMIIRIPGSYNGTTANAKAGGLNQGALINSATINVDGSNPMEQAVDIIFRSMKIIVTDAEAIYP